MTNIESKLAAKREELKAASDEQARLWLTFTETDKIRNKQMTDWGNASEKQKSIQHDIDVLEGVLNELASV